MFGLAFCLEWVIAQVQLLDYQGYQLQYDCKQRTAHRWQYTLNVPKIMTTTTRPKVFTLDPKLNLKCQQFSTEAYATVHEGFDRGHLATSFHMNANQKLRIRANYMTNIVPQARSLNEGLWKDIEMLTECLRPDGVVVYGGVIYSDASNDYFLKTHGIKTPELFWKVLVSKGNAIAWLFPNSNDLKPSVDDYLVSVLDIEKKINDGLGPIPIPTSLKAKRVTKTWTCS